MNILEFTVKVKIPDRLGRLLVKLVLLYRRLRYGYPFRRIPLTQGKYAIVDPEDYERLSRYKWHAAKCNGIFYAGRHIKINKGKKWRYIKMHREIVKVPDGMFVDHINHNGLDNRKANLRPATHAQNMSNRVSFKPKTSTSKYKGVSWHKNRKQWQVQISFNGRCKSVGYFDDEIEAARAYDEAAKKYHGEFASLNFP